MSGRTIIDANSHVTKLPDCFADCIEGEAPC